MNKKISCKEIFTITFLLTVSQYPGFGNILLLTLADSTSLIVCLAAIPIIFLIISGILYISKKMNGKNIFEYNKDNFKFFGIILNVILVIVMLYLTYIMSWHLLNFTVSQFLTETPYIFLTVCFFSIILYGAIKGIETIGRTSLILMFLLIITVIFTFIFLFNNIDINNIFPIMNIKTASFAKALAATITLSTAPCFLLLIIRRENVIDDHNFNKAVLLGVGCAVLVAIAFLFLSISVLGIELSKLYSSPEYALYKKIKILNFLQRVENFVSVNTFIVMFTELTILFYFIKEYFLHIFHKRVKKRIISNVLISILVFIIPITATYITINYSPGWLYLDYYYLIIPLYIFLVISILLALIKKKKFNLQ